MKLFRKTEQGSGKCDCWYSGSLFRISIPYIRNGISRKTGFIGTTNTVHCIVNIRNGERHEGEYYTSFMGVI